MGKKEPPPTTPVTRRSGRILGVGRLPQHQKKMIMEKIKKKEGDQKRYLRRGVAIGGGGKD